MCVSCDSGLSSGILLGSAPLSIALGEMFVSEIGYTPRGCVARLPSSLPFYFFYFMRLLEEHRKLRFASEINLVLKKPISI